MNRVSTYSQTLLGSVRSFNLHLQLTEDKLLGAEYSLEKPDLHFM